MQRGLEHQTVEYEDSMPSHQLTQQMASIGISAVPSKSVK